MSVRRLSQRIRIGGIETPVLSISTDHGVNKPVGTGSITLPGPRPSHVDLGAPIKIEVGYDDDIQTIFDGVIANDEAAFSESGGVVRVALEGHGRLLRYTNPAVQAVTGPVALHSVFTAFCKARGVPFRHADLATTPSGSTINIGGNTKVDDGKVIVEPTESPGAVIERISDLFGYRVFDTPGGVHRFQKVSGLPVGAPVREFVEGVNILNVRQSRTITGVVNYWDVRGASYTAVDGSTVAIRSIPATVPSNPLLGPAGVNHKEVRDEALVTQALADACRNVQEIDFSTPHYLWNWTRTGDNGLRPGLVVKVNSPMVGGVVNLWLTNIAHSITEQGWTTTMEGWAGAGQALPAGDDCLTITLLSVTRHLGNEYLAHYRVPNPDGLMAWLSFTVAEAYSSLTIRGFAHGTNSFVGNTQSTASRFEIWQGGVSVASGELPRQNENLDKRYDYSIDTYWSAITVPLSGSISAGAAELRIISGYDSAVGDYDDFEAKDLILITCGVGSPVIIS